MDEEQNIGSLPSLQRSSILPPLPPSTGSTPEQLPSMESGIARDMEQTQGSSLRDLEVHTSTKSDHQRTSQFDGYRDWDELETGYPRFSAFMVADPDKDGVIFRRFDRASARNLLILETEVAKLESDLEQLESPENMKCYPALRNAARDWLALEEMATNYSNGINKSLAYGMADRMRKTQLKLREKLKEYHESLILYNQVIALGEPRRRALKASRQIFNMKWDWENSKEKMLTGPPVEKRLNEDLQGDLCTLKTVKRNPEPDRLTRLFEGRLAFLFREKKPSGQHTEYIRHGRVDAVVSMISSALAALFLVGAIFGLYYLKQDRIRSLILLTGLVIGFAISLAMLTNARRQDVFAITAAYAAVLVVFVSSG